MGRATETQMIGLVFQALLAILTLDAVIFTSQTAIAEVSILHDGTGKEPGTILIHSEIRKGDLAAFVRAADSIKDVSAGYTINNVPFITVDLDTPGGDVMEAVQIGRLVRDRFMYTRVLPERKCVSACVFILIAGTSRIVADAARVGLHRPKFDSIYFAGLTAENARRKYNALVEELRKFLLTLAPLRKPFASCYLHPQIMCTT